MKTLFLYTDKNDISESFFFELEGNFSHLHEVYFNETNNEKLSDELDNILFNKDQEFKVKKLLSPTKDWDFFVKVGFFD